MWDKDKKIHKPQKQITFFMCSNMSLTAFSVIPLMVNVLPLLVCPYAKIVAAGNYEFNNRR